ncbi:T9SS type A sorting domain-containing protein [Ekhidna sp. To15]|uniref:T9SS type A sorting domain-containing protein n=1 Tax=Ekhidna sp. To15 TaxID=3395267 RepID=UPI003F51B874
MKSTISNSTTSYSNNKILLSHTIGQTSLINSVQTESIQLLQGFEYQLFFKNNEQSTNNELFAYPNPTIGPISIKRESAKPEHVQLVIYDLKGMVVKSFERRIDTRYIKIDLSSLPKGSYQIRVTGENHNYGNCSILLK